MTQLKTLINLIIAVLICLLSLIIGVYAISIASLMLAAYYFIKYTHNDNGSTRKEKSR